MIKVTPDVAKGQYSNVMNVQSTKEEFVLDFLSLFPPLGIMAARILISPGHMKRMVAALTQTVSKYEKQFGTIEVAHDPKGDKQIGFNANR